MGKWLEKTLGELTSFMAKGIPPKYVEDTSQNTIRVLNQKCNRNYRISYSQSRLHDNGAKQVPEDKMLKDFDVLINSTGTGTAGRVAQIWQIPEPTTIDGHMILIRPTQEIDPLYYGYAIKAFQSQIEEFAEGSTGQTEINKRRLQDEIIIRFPASLDEQRIIGRTFKAVDEKIQNNEAINENLAAYISRSETSSSPDMRRGNRASLIVEMCIFSLILLCIDSIIGVMNDITDRESSFLSTKIFSLSKSRVTIASKTAPEALFFNDTIALSA